MLSLVNARTLAPAFRTFLQKGHRLGPRIHMLTPNAFLRDLTMVCAPVTGPYLDHVGFFVLSMHDQKGCCVTLRPTLTVQNGREHMRQGVEHWCHMLPAYVRVLDFFLHGLHGSLLKKSPLAIHDCKEYWFPLVTLNFWFSIYSEHFDEQSRCRDHN